MKNYFAILELPAVFALDQAALQRSYLAKQQEFHPDRQAGKTDGERQRALLHSMEINQAYAALKSPLKRAQHLLELAGIRVNGERDTIKPPPSLLMEVMELRESLTECKTPQALEIFRTQAQQLHTQALESLAAAFAKNQMETAAHCALRLNYLEKILQDATTHARMNRTEAYHEPATNT